MPQLFGVFVDDLFQFLADFTETVENYRLFPLRHIRNPQDDDDGINMPGNAQGVEDWLQRMGLIH